MVQNRKDENLRCKNGNFHVERVPYGSKEAKLLGAHGAASGSYELRSSGLSGAFHFSGGLIMRRGGGLWAIGGGCHPEEFPIFAELGEVDCEFLAMIPPSERPKAPDDASDLHVY